jgi:hypothetical protein
MRLARKCLLLIALTASFAVYADQQPPAKPAPDETQLAEHGHYVNKDGHIVHSPAHAKNGGTPSGATARCRDGTYSFSQHHRGTCSHHGGVTIWL